MSCKVDIEIVSNMRAALRSNGKLVTERVGHNVFTVNGKNWLSKLCGWKTLSTPGLGDDTAYTSRRVRWMAVGSGANLEVVTVSSLNTPVAYDSSGNHLAPIDSTEFPTSTSVKFIKEFGANEISISGIVSVSEAGLFVDVNDVDNLGGDEDSPFGTGEATTLDPTEQFNPPVAYHTFEALPKSTDFTLAIEWEFRF